MLLNVPVKASSLDSQNYLRVGLSCIHAYGQGQTPLMLVLIFQVSFASVSVRILHFVQPLPTGPDVNDLSLTHTYAHTHSRLLTLCVSLTHACMHTPTHSLT